MRRATIVTANDIEVEIKIGRRILEQLLKEIEETIG
jgi:hypothetical protein